MKTFQGKGRFFAVECDVAKEEDVTRIFQWVKKNLNNVHVLVNNAGIVMHGKIIGIIIIYY